MITGNTIVTSLVCVVAGVVVSVGVQGGLVGDERQDGGLRAGGLHQEGRQPAAGARQERGPLGPHQPAAVDT